MTILCKPLPILFQIILSQHPKNARDSKKHQHLLHISGTNRIYYFIRLLQKIEKLISVIPKRKIIPTAFTLSQSSTLSYPGAINLVSASEKSTHTEEAQIQAII